MDPQPARRRTLSVVRRLLPAFILATLLLAACGDGSTATTTAAEAATTTTTPGSSSTDTVTPPESSSSSTTADGDATFAITEVDFPDGTVTITNVGEVPGNLDGHAICQRPNYFTFGDILLNPGESYLFDAGSIGSIAPDNGEIALYSTADFGSADAILSYLEWGESGHGRSSVAVAAGIWPEGGFVETTTNISVLTTMGEIAIDPDEWAVG